MKNKRIVFIVAFLALILSTFIGVTYSAFTDKAAILGSNFSVGSSDIKLLQDITLGTIPENLVDELSGPSFSNIGPYWETQYLVKIFNNSPEQVQLTSNANYETINDPDDLRQIIFVEPIAWDDINGDGIVDEGETGVSLGRKTIIKWKTEGFDFGLLESGSVKSLILKFSTDSVSDTKQGTSALFDFEFDAMGIE